MPILRDIAARLGLQLDKKSFVKAERSIGGLVTQLGSLGAIVVGSGAALALGRIVTLGSDANETLNVLNASFGDNATAVQQWAADFGTAAGRSEFELREMAGTLGAVLNPLMERNEEVAADMSTQLTELAVDLGSFFNAQDTDALEALRSGIVGEAEPLKRFGIVMQEATLQAFALEQGITKSVKSMSIAEKTTLRYNFILDQTAIAQGDAAKTSEGWANASKGLVSALKDLGTRLGLTIIPFAEKIVTSTRNVVRAFLEWQKGTNFLKAALILLGAIGAKVALTMLIAWGPVLLPLLKMVAIFVVAALVLDDFLTFMEGGDSVIGRFIDSLFGPGSATQAALYLKEAWEGMKLFWVQEVIPAMEALGAKIFDVTTAMGESFSLFFADVKKNVDAFKEAFTALWNDIKLGYEVLIEGITKAFTGFFDDIKLGIDTIAQAFKNTLGPISEALTKGASLLGIDINAGGGAPRAQGERGLQTQTLAQPGGAAGGTSETNVENSVTINVQGSATANDAGRIADAAGEAQRKANRRTRAALVQRAE
jgi:hypothetical protein